MYRISTATRVVAGSADEDRVSCVETPDGLTIVLADGAGGIAGGRQAAEFTTNRKLANLSSKEDCEDHLRQLDTDLLKSTTAGEAACSMLVLRKNQFFGASVGDCGVWALTSEAIFDLTKNQIRKPLLGSGQAKPVGFGPHFLNDPVVIASDGLLKYAARSAYDEIRLRRFSSIEDSADALVDAVRLESGALQDDLSFVLLVPHQD